MRLYELISKSGLAYSQFAWRTRLALAHKGLSCERVPVRISDKAAIAFSGQDKVPILVTGDRIVCDSWDIALFLEREYPDRPSLFGGPIGEGATEIFNHWVDRALVPRLVPLLMIDLQPKLDDQDARHLRSRVETAFGKSLETLAVDRQASIKGFRRELGPVRATLRNRPFLGGDAPAYVDYILFSLFKWAGMISDFEVLEPDDIVMTWHKHMFARCDEDRPDRAAGGIDGRA